MTFIATLEELKNIQVIENDEPMVLLNGCGPKIHCNTNHPDMVPFTGENLWVRRSVRDKILHAQEILGDDCLFIHYGYRHPKVQQKYWEVIAKQFVGFSEEELHQMIAHPLVAGHPAGAAVDVTLYRDGKELDMGCSIADFSDPEKIKTFSEKITESQLKYRKLLLDAMKGAGFAPFYGEWWHFSFGDREWAAFYNRPHALYGSISIE